MIVRERMYTNPLFKQNPTYSQLTEFVAPLLINSKFKSMNKHKIILCTYLMVHTLNWKQDT